MRAAVAGDNEIVPEVLKRIRGFAAMNRLKKEAVKVGGPWVFLVQACVCVRVHVSVCVRACARACVRTTRWPRLRFLFMCMPVCVPACLCVCVCLCVRACVRVRRGRS